MKPGLYLLTLVAICMAIGGCSARVNTQQVRSYKPIYLEEFRLTYFKKLFRAGFNNTAGVDSLFQLDHSHFTEPVLTESDHHLIDSLVYVDNKQMISDSLEAAPGRIAEGAEGKHVLGYIVSRMDDKAVRQLALRRYKIWKRTELKYLSMP